MQAWGIWSYQPPGWNGTHPCVIVSHPARVAHKPFVSILMCTSQRSNRPAEVDKEVLLDAEDGLNWETLCKCDLIYGVPKADLKERRGKVGSERRRQIIRTMLVANGWLD